MMIRPRRQRAEKPSEEEEGQQSQPNYDEDEEESGGSERSSRYQRPIRQRSALAERSQRNGVERIVSQKELPKLPKIEKGPWISSNHKISWPPSQLKLRVQLLKYLPSGDRLGLGDGGEQRFTILEEREFGWQEKVWSTKEREKLGHIQEDGSYSYLYSYVDTDSYTVKKANRSPVVRKWAETNTTASPKENDEEWEELPSTKLTTTKMPEKDEKDEEQKISEKTPQLSSRSRSAKKEAKELTEAAKRREEAAQKKAQLDDLLHQEEAQLSQLLNKNMRARRPVTALSSSLLHMRPLPESPKREESQIERRHSLSHVIHRRSRALSSHILLSRRRTRPFEKLRCQLMFIMASVPGLDKETKIVSIKAYPSAGMFSISAPKGFRTIETNNRKERYRIYWELVSSPKLRNEMDVDKTTNVPYLEFEPLPLNCMEMYVNGEIVSARGFQFEPLCVHYMLELPKGWSSFSPYSLEGTTHSSYTNDESVAHFSTEFSSSLSFSMDSLGDEEIPSCPLLLIMVMALRDNGAIRNEGYGYVPLPSAPGPHSLRVRLWKPAARDIVERMQDLFLDATPSLLDVSAAHIPRGKTSLKLGNRLGLKTEPSGEVCIRLHIMHHSANPSGQSPKGKLELLEKMISATILRSVEAVIAAFNRARNKATLLKSAAAAFSRSLEKNKNF